MKGEILSGRIPQADFGSAYLKLCEKYIERMRIKLCAESMEIKNDNTLRVLLSTQSKEKSDIEEEEEKIDAAKGGKR